MDMNRERLAAMGFDEEEVRELQALREETEAMRASLEAERCAFAAYREAAENRSREVGFRALLREAGIPPRRCESILRVTNLSSLRLAEDGTIAERDAELARIRSEWADLIPEARVISPPVEHPPQGAATVTRESILAIRDTGRRQREIAGHMELFGR